MSKKLLSLILLFSLIILTISTRILKEEPEEETEKTNTEEEPCDETSDTTDYSTIPESQIRKENLPHSQVLLPIRRIGTSNMQLGEGPCGGVEKKLANTLTNKGSSINVVWEILVPENTGNCTVRISNGKQDEESFKLLQPTEGKINQDGSFTCGRNKGFEHQEFILPENYECDGCTLQWKWSTSYGDIYSCSDIIINGGSLSKCLGKCLNGGSCFNGKCLCLEGFSGDFCEDTEGQMSLTWLWYLIIIAILGVAGYFIYKNWQKIKEWFNTINISWLSNSPRNNEIPFGNRDNNNISSNIAENSKQI